MESHWGAKGRDGWSIWVLIHEKPEGGPWWGEKKGCGFERRGEMGGREVGSAGSRRLDWRENQG